MLIGPYIFRDDRELPCTVNADRYIKMLQEYFLPALQRQGIDLRSIFFQQDLATPHTSHRALEFLQSHFGDCVISKGIWPARSPDLAPPDFYLFGDLKQKIYRNSPQCLEELEEAIQNQLAKISRDTLKSVFQSLVKRIRACKASKGGHFQQRSLFH